MTEIEIQEFIDLLRNPKSTNRDIRLDLLATPLDSNGSYQIHILAEEDRVALLDFVLNTMAEKFRLKKHEVINTFVDGDGATVLHRACNKGALDTVKYLADKQADVNREMNGDTRPINIAVLREDEPLINFLISSCVFVELSVAA